MGVVGRTGFVGRLSLGVIKEWELKHSVEFSLGVYSNEGRSYTQSNIGYRYSRWQYDWQNKTLHPLQLGIFVTRSLDQKGYFLKSPPQYPDANYYDETRIRGGVEFGSALTFWSTRLETAYMIRVLDSGMIALLNNSNKDLQYYISSSFSLRYRFE